MRSHAQWRARGIRALQDLRSWLAETNEGNERSDSRLAQAVRAVEDDRINVVVSGHCQRGKSELINALFFADYGRRLLPVSGVSSACSAELFWDRDAADSYVRLLPIESRGEDATVAELKRQPDRWVRFPLRPQEPEQMRIALEEIHQRKRLSRTQAARLGLMDLQDRSRPGIGGGMDQIEVPRWRHALISFPHPLLKKGLVIHDMPGLAALDLDPESARTLIDDAHALIFTVAADSGVDRADLAVWQQYLLGFRSERRSNILVALTKADMVRQQPGDGGIDLEQRRQRVARTLGTSESLVLAVSARSGLTARIADKPMRLRDSGIPELEAMLGERMIASKHAACRRVVEDQVGALLETSIGLLTARIEATRSRISELQTMIERSTELEQRLLTHTKRDRDRYLQAVEMFQSARKELLEAAAPCRRLLDRGELEQLVSAAHRSMTQSWTSAGVARAMKQLFDELRHRVAQTSGDSEALHRRLQEWYGRMQQQAGIQVQMPSVFKPSRYRAEMELLHAEAKAFRSSQDMLLAEQGAAITRFHRRLVDRVRLLIEQLRTDWDDWIRLAMVPLAREIQGFKQAMEQRLDQLQRVHGSRAEIDREVAALRQTHVRLAKQMTLLRNIHNTLEHEPAAPPGRERRPYLATRDGRAV